MYNIESFITQKIRERVLRTITSVYIEKGSLQALPLSSTIGHKLTEVASRKENLTSSVYIGIAHES